MMRVGRRFEKYFRRWPPWFSKVKCFTTSKGKNAKSIGVREIKSSKCSQLLTNGQKNQSIGLRFKIGYQTGLEVTVMKVSNIRKSGRAKNQYVIGTCKEKTKVAKGRWHA